MNKSNNSACVGRGGLIALCALVWLAGCDGTGDTPGTPDAQPDAPLQSINGLGQLCDDANPCPQSPAHTCVYLNSGSQVQGYCSPNCTVDQECRDGYTGPDATRATCFNPTVPDTCTVSCDLDEHCPGDTKCLATGGPFMVCGAPP